MAEDKKTTYFLVALALQIALVLAIVVFKVSILSGGSDVFLEIEPVDPRDPLRGDYVTFNLAISRIEDNRLLSTGEDSDIEVGDTVYVVLSRGSNDVSYVDYVVTSKPDTGEVHKLFLKGQVTNTFGTTFAVKYGLEEYFIPEGTGINFNFRNREAIVHARVDQDGNAVLKELFIDGQPWP